MRPQLPLMRAHGLVVLAAWLAILASPAQAQLPLLAQTEKPDLFVREAFAAPFGRALIAEFGKVLNAAVDPACLQAKNIRAEDLGARGGELYIRWGTKTVETVLGTIDTGKYESTFAATAGRNAYKELERLREDPQVKRYLAMERPARLAKVADFAVEQFDRYALLKRLNLKAVSPLGTGNEELLHQNPTEKVEDELDAFVRKTKSRSLTRFLDLSEKAGAAAKISFRKEEALRMGPTTYLQGVDADLTELCVGPRPVRPQAP